jgi:hypothetical protein
MCVERGVTPTVAAVDAPAAEKSYDLDLQLEAALIDFA